MNVKRIVSVLVAAVMIVLAAGAMAERRVDDTGAYVYDYDKSAYDCIVFGDRTYGAFLQGHGNSSYDYDRFLNSEFGEKYAYYAMLAVNYPNPMDENLLAVWRDAGMDKVMVHPEGAQDSANDYYVYTPVNIAEGETFPLVVVNHGRGANARVCESFGWVELAGKERFMLVMCENTEPQALHDVIAQVKESYPVDSSRVYMTGTSQGASHTKQYASLYTEELAAIAPMNVSFSYLDGVDGDVAALKQKGMPMLFVAGTADVYNPLPVRNNASSPLFGSIDGWNQLLEIEGFESYQITEEESRELLNTSLNLLESYTGVRLPDDVTVYNFINNRVFQCNFTDDAGVTRLSLVIEENGSHEPLGCDAELAWAFLKQFTR